MQTYINKLFKWPNLNKLFKWLNLNKLFININKTIVLIFNIRNKL